jgi:hypothetical protein
MLNGFTPRRLIFATAFGVLATLTTGCQPSPDELTASHTATIDRYCLDCHNAIDREAGLVLERRDPANLAADAEVWEKVVRKLRGNLMPPPGGPRPDGETVDELVTYLETS